MSGDGNDRSGGGDAGSGDVWADAVAEAAEAVAAEAAKAAEAARAAKAAEAADAEATADATAEAAEADAAEDPLAKRPEPAREDEAEIPVRELPLPAAEDAAEPDAGAEAPKAAPGGSGSAPDLGPLVDEVRRIAGVLGEKVTQAQEAVRGGSGDPMLVLQNLAAPLRTKNPAVYGHLLAAGGELIAAYRAVVTSAERKWSSPPPQDSQHIDLD